MTLTAEKLKEVLYKHKKWISEEEGGKRADLSLSDLRGANLCWANLCGADLCGADLRGADLRVANLCGADLSMADLRGANLRVADLRGANLCGADLCGANLSMADLRGAKDLFFPVCCPEEGEFIAFKKAAYGTIVKLKIPAYAKRSSAATRKCRCDKAIVLSIENADGTPYEEKSVHSCYNKDFVYTVGQEVYVSNFDDNRWNECSKGIHFFITREEAARYEM